MFSYDIEETRNSRFVFKSGYNIDFKIKKLLLVAVNLVLSLRNLIK